MRETPHTATAAFASCMCGNCDRQAFILIDLTWLNINVHLTRVTGMDIHIWTFHIQSWRSVVFQ